MNKLGFYTKNFGATGVVEALKTIKIPVLLTELDDFSILEKIRNEWSPDTFIIGRFHHSHQEQGAMLDSSDLVGVGRKLAEKCLTYNFNFGKRRGNNDRLFIDAWMSLNEVVRGPNSFPQDKTEWTAQHQQEFEKMEQQAAAYDTIQVAFWERLNQEGLEAVAFNFAAGNWINGEDYVKYFPKTLATYTYLGFHEYGWPHMNPLKQGASSGCGYYQKSMANIRQKYGKKHQVIITETGLARMYMYQDSGGDVGWLYPNGSVSEESYKDSLRWYNNLLCSHSYVIGACLFQVGPGQDWETFRHTGQDNLGNPITLMDELYAMSQEPAPVAVTPISTTFDETTPTESTPVITIPTETTPTESTPVTTIPAETTPTEPPSLSDKQLIETIMTAGEKLVIPLNRKAKFYQVAQENGLGERLTDEYEVTFGNWNYVAQLFEGGLVFAQVGQWDETQLIRNPPTAT